MFDPLTPATYGPAGEADVPFTFGMPASTYLPLRDEARLALLRTRIDDACRHIGKRSLQARVIEYAYTRIHA